MFASIDTINDDTLEFLRLLGRNVRKARHARNLSIAKATDGLGIPESLLEEIENGEFYEISMVYVEHLARYFRVQPWELAHPDF